MTITCWVKYNLHKDGSPVWDGFDDREKAEEHRDKLRKEFGYNAVIVDTIEEDSK